MELRELENKSYLDIAETCVKKINIVLNKEIKTLSNTIDFSSLNIINESEYTSNVNISYKEGENEKTIQLDVGPFTSDFFIDNNSFKNIIEIEIESNGKCIINYEIKTNLSTIKSQISKGRQMIQNMLGKKFNFLDKHGLHINEFFQFNEKKEELIDIMDGYNEN
jgi:hypothetical protein